jgi:hypothetical protein
MKIKRDGRGVILNANELTVDDVVNNRVLCPACGSHVFERWPLGWDAHAAHRCSGVNNSTPEDRKTEFKQRYIHLFR